MQYFVDSAHSVNIFVKKYFQSTYFVIFREIALKGSVLYIFLFLSGSLTKSIRKIMLIRAGVGGVSVKLGSV